MTNFFSLQKSKSFCLKIKCALFYELIFMQNLVLPLFFTVKKGNRLCFTQKKSFSMQFLMGKKSVGLRKQLNRTCWHSLFKMAPLGIKFAFFSQFYALWYNLQKSQMIWVTWYVRVLVKEASKKSSLKMFRSCLFIHQTSRSPIGRLLFTKSGHYFVLMKSLLTFPISRQEYTLQL